MNESANRSAGGLMERGKRVASSSSSSKNCITAAECARRMLDLGGRA